MENHSQFLNLLGKIFILTIFSFTILQASSSVSDVIERFDEVFLHESTQDNSRDKSNQVFCNETDPICKKFQLMFGNENKRKSNSDDKIMRIERKTGENVSNHELNCDPNDPICKKYQIMFQNNQNSLNNSNYFKSREEGGDEQRIIPKENIPFTPENGGGLKCDRANPICLKFQALLGYQQKRKGNKPGGSGGKPNPGGSSGQTPWCEFYCQYLNKVCYSNGTCGDAVVEEKT